MTTPSSDREVRMQNQSHRIGPLTLAASLCRSSVSKFIADNGDTLGDAWV
jgi:hypothetical protein